MKSFAVSVLAILFYSHALAGSVEPRAGWQVHQTDKPYKQLIADLKTAVKAEGLIVVSQAGPTVAASRQRRSC